jgi:hypothetical protein
MPLAQLVQWLAVPQVLLPVLLVLLLTLWVVLRWAQPTTL